MAEGERTTAETTRKDAETERKAAERARQMAETARMAAESAREGVEARRQKEHAAMLLWGAYDSAQAYVPGNKVSIGGRSYICVMPCTGMAPPGDYWQLIADKGTQGEQGLPGESGVVTTVEGMFGLSVDSETGDVFFHTPDGATSVSGEMDENGDVYIIFDEEVAL